MAQKPVIIRQVWADNLMFEFSLIQKSISQFPFVSFDTEFPGTVLEPTISKNLMSHVPPNIIYYLMKRNVDILKLVQVGLALSDSEGNLPSFGANTHYVWQFNFKDFDRERDLHNLNSIQFLARQGMNFNMNKAKGIDSWIFAWLLVSSGLVMNQYSCLTWITFHGCYDLGFLIKILTGKSLPNDMASFLLLVRYYLGVRVYDMKYMTISVPWLNGGLEKVAKLLGVNRVAGNSHQAGSDSLLTLQMFMRFKHFLGNNHIQSLNGNFNGFEGLLFGLSPRMRLSWT